MAKCPSCNEAYEGVNFCPVDGARLLAADRCQLSPLVGQVLDKRYRVVRKVGDGASAEVFYAEHIHLNKQIALKVLRPELAGRSEAIERFQREAQVASGIGHPNIVKIEDFCILEDGSFYLAMEWLDGETLGGRLARGRMPLDVAIAIARQVCSGLDAAHRVSIIHRDLKPANIFLQEGARGRLGIPTVKILDFGIAKFTLANTQLTRAGVFLGTPYYVSPEQATARPIDHRADIYSLGVIMYEMVTGGVPFDGDTAITVLQQHVQAEPIPPRRRAPDREISPDLEAIIMRCLHKTPEKRYGRASDVEQALADLDSVPRSTLPGIGTKLADLGLEVETGKFARSHVVDTDAETLYRDRRSGSMSFDKLDDPESAENEFNQLSKTTRIARSYRPREDATPPPPARISAERSVDIDSTAIEPIRPRTWWLLAGAIAAVLGVAGVATYKLAGGGDEQPAAADAALQAGDIDASSLPSRWTVRHDQGDVKYSVYISPSIIEPGQPFTLEVAFDDHGDQPGTAVLALGSLTRTLPVSAAGVATTTVEVAEPGPVEVTVRLERPGVPAAESRFELCVGADPRDPEATAARCGR